MKMIALLLTILLGHSCAAKKLAAQHADTLLENQIEKRLPLYSAQKAALAKDVDAFLNQQKEATKEALPLINKLELDVTKIDQQYDALDGFYRRLALNFSKLMSKYMALLDDKQQKEFAQNLRDENKKMAKVQGPDRMENIYDRFETLFGTISDSQKSLLETHKNHLDERQGLRLQRREKLHAKFLEIYQMDLSNESRAKYFTNAFEDFQSSYPDSPKNKEIIKQIIPTLSKEQKEYFAEKTGDLKEILGYYLETNY